MSVLLETRNLTQRFGGLCAISDCNLQVVEGETHGVIGPNGAGKTTLFNLITGIYKPSEGEILFQGEAIAGLRPNRIALKGIARTFQNIRLFKTLSVLDNIRIAYDSQLKVGPLRAMFNFPALGADEVRGAKWSMEVLEAFGLAQFSESPAEDLPYGSQRRLEIARALALRPQVLLLDEPAAGLNSSETLKLMEFLRWVRSTYSVTIVLIEHHMKMVMGLCDRITVLDFGVTIGTGTPDEIRNNPRVIEAYLGAEVDS